MKVSGIYIITSNIKPNRIYVGSAVNINKRKREHLNSLKRGDHCNNKLQRHYNKYGRNDLNFYIILECTKNDLLKLEQYFIDFYKPYFNICIVAGSNFGLKRSEETINKLSNSLMGNKNAVGCKRSTEAKEKLRDIHIGKNNHMFGKHLSEDTKNKMKSTIKYKKLKNINNHN